MDLIIIDYLSQSYHNVFNNKVKIKENYCFFTKVFYNIDLFHFKMPGSNSIILFDYK